MKDLQSEARIRDLEQRMAAMPGSRIFVGLAEEYRRAGRFSDALATLRNGLEAHPTYLSARIAIARLYQETGRVQEAIDAFSKVLVSDRENLVAAKALGDLYGRQGNAVEAIKKLKLYRALAGDRSVDERIAALEREANPEPAAPHDVPGPPSFPPAAAAAPAASSPAASRLFDPMNYADTSGAFELGPNAGLALSTLDFTPTEEADLPIETTRPFEGIPAVPLDPPAAKAPFDPAESDPPAAVDAAPPEELVRMAETFPAAEELESAEEVPADAPEAAEELPGGELEAAAGAVPDEAWEPAVEFPAEPDAPSPSAIAELPPSRTLAELYERQGFPEEARQIYDRLAVDPREPAADWVPAAGPDAVRVPEPPSAPVTADSDPRERKRRTIEAWLVRIRTNAAAGAR
jgi:tetratricopeptide (TPR) repeat protein